VSIVDDVLDLFERWGGEGYDEVVTQTDHALQCAALARRDGADDALVAAALLHDVGHLLDLAAGGSVREGVDVLHEERGRAYLAPHLPDPVTRPIALHVAAKRFLCATEPSYADGLSPGSQRSLLVQGGPMTATESAAFRAAPGADAGVRLRRWDDAGKVLGLHRPSVAFYRPLLERLTGEGT